MPSHALNVAQLEQFDIAGIQTQSQYAGVPPLIDVRDELPNPLYNYPVEDRDRSSLNDADDFIILLWEATDSDNDEQEGNEITINLEEDCSPMDLEPNLCDAPAEVDEPEDQERDYPSNSYDELFEGDCLWLNDIPRDDLPLWIDESISSKDLIEKLPPLFEVEGPQLNKLLLIMAALPIAQHEDSVLGPIWRHLSGYTTFEGE